MPWIYVMEESALPEGSLAPAYPLGLNLVVARVEGAIHALSGRCLHMACPLFTGALEGRTLTCACHDWRFDVQTGRFLDAPELVLATYPTRVESGKVYVNTDQPGEPQ